MFTESLGLNSHYSVCWELERIQSVLGQTFKKMFQVDEKTISESTVVAQAIPPAIPPAGSLRLGCRRRDQTSRANLGAVELYLFSMWADLENHALCEDGAVIGWNAASWGVTSPKARQRDPSLMCGEKKDPDLRHIVQASAGAPR